MIAIRYYNTGKLVQGLESVTRLVENTELTNEIVGQPLEDGRQINDHIIINPDVFSWELYVSNTAYTELKKDNTITIGEVAKNVYGILADLRDQRQLLIIESEHHIIKPVAIRSISFNNNAPYHGALNIKVDFQKLQSVSSLEVELEKQKSQNTYEISEANIKEVFKGELPTEKTIDAKINEWFKNNWEVTPLAQGLIKASNACQGISTNLQDWSRGMDNITSKVRSLSDFPNSLLKISKNFTAAVKDTINIGYAVVEETESWISEALTQVNDNTDLIASVFNAPTSLKLELEKVTLQFDLTYDKMATCWKADCISLNEDDKGNLTKEYIFSQRIVSPNSDLFEGIEIEGVAGLNVVIPGIAPADGLGNSVDTTIMAFAENNCSLAVIKNKEALQSYNKLLIYDGSLEHCNITVEELGFKVEAQ